MDMQFRLRAVLFDLDGTLIDTVGDLAIAAERTLAEFGRAPRSIDDVRTYVGRGMANLVRRCLCDGVSDPADDATVEAAIEVFRRHYAEVNGRFSTVYPGVPDTLAAMRAMGLNLACVTNKPEAFTVPLLARMEIDHYFSAVVSGDTLPVKKPDPAMLEHACRLLDTPVTQSLMIGDSANDAQAARAAGMPVLLVTYGYTEGMAVDTLECDGLLSNTTDALPLIARI